MPKTSHASAASASATAAADEDRQPAPISDQHDRKQQTELRLVGQQAKADARKHWAPFQKIERAPDQRRREEAVLSGRDIPQRRRKAERDRNAGAPPRILASVAA